MRIFFLFFQVCLLIANFNRKNIKQVATSLKCIQSLVKSLTLRLLKSNKQLLLLSFKDYNSHVIFFIYIFFQMNFQFKNFQNLWWAPIRSWAMFVKAKHKIPKTQIWAEYRYSPKCRIDTFYGRQSSSIKNFENFSTERSFDKVTYICI